VYRYVIRPLLYLLPAETAHHLAFGLLRLVMAIPGVRGLARIILRPESDVLRVEALGLVFPNPVGLAAGFDKDAVGHEALGALGFGFVEVGTITAEAQPGNPRPRLFRLQRDRALVNRMGFNNRGAEAAARRLRVPRRTITGVNIGKTKRVDAEHAVSDYVKSTRLLAPLADYLVVNVSSPNTPGLRDLQAVDALRPLLRAVQAAADEASPDRRVPLLVKIAPDLADEDVDAVANLAIELGLDGIVATNTTVSREGLATPSERVARCGAGGLSGAPLKSRALEVLRRLSARAGGRLALVSVGGIENAEDAWERLQAGATLVQVYTAFVYEGPFVARSIARGLERRLTASGAV
jgi:dihydroorotate dehydrogenase